MRRLVLVAMVAMMAAAACGSSGSAGADNPTSDTGARASAQASCLDWCGSGTATVTIAGTPVTITGGGCVIQGDSVDARFGDWYAGGDVTNGLQILAYKTVKLAPTVNGKAGTTRFQLGADAAAKVTDTSGTFSGTNAIGGKEAITGTFTCK